MEIDPAADRFLIRRRIIEIRHILPDIANYLAETTDPERKAWLEQMERDFREELATLEAKAKNLEA